MMKLYVGNLPYRATDAELQDWFVQAGVACDSVSIIYDRFSGESRGFGFVEISDHNLGQQAIETCNGREFLGRALVINEARPARESGGGGGRGRPGGPGRDREYGGDRPGRR